VAESSRHGQDRVTGVLHVSSREAYFADGDRRLRVVSAAPMTAVGIERLLAQTATNLRNLSGKRVRAEGDLQGDLLWRARIIPADESSSAD